MHGQRENSIPPTNKVCGGYNNASNMLDENTLANALQYYQLKIDSYMGDMWVTRIYEIVLQNKFINICINLSSNDFIILESAFNSLYSGKPQNKYFCKQ